MKAVSELAEAKVGLPQIMNHTILPAKVIARAWLDESYRASLLRTPRDLLLQASRVWPASWDYHVDVSTEEEHFLPLPHCRPELLASLPDGRLFELLEYETGSDKSLTYWLPSEIMFKAFTDSAFQSELLRQPNDVLQREGFEPPAGRVVIRKNTERVCHLVLPRCPVEFAGLEYDAVVHSLIVEFGGDTTKCCATGTCA